MDFEYPKDSMSRHLHNRNQSIRNRLNDEEKQKINDGTRIDLPFLMDQEVEQWCNHNLGGKSYSNFAVEWDSDGVLVDEIWYILFEKPVDAGHFRLRWI